MFLTIAASHPKKCFPQKVCHYSIGNKSNNYNSYTSSKMSTMTTTTTTNLTTKDSSNTIQHVDWLNKDPIRPELQLKEQIIWENRHRWWLKWIFRQAKLNSRQVVLCYLCPSLGVNKEGKCHHVKSWNTMWPKSNEVLEILKKWTWVSLTIILSRYFTILKSRIFGDGIAQR